jgi:hypothetical protein
MEWHQLYFEILFQYLRKQNLWLLREIAHREGIAWSELKKLAPSKRQLRDFLRHLPSPAAACDTVRLSPNDGRSPASAFPR